MCVFVRVVLCCWRNVKHVFCDLLHPLGSRSLLWAPYLRACYLQELISVLVGLRNISNTHVIVESRNRSIALSSWDW
jgi:hypothetical protein